MSCLFLFLSGIHAGTDISRPVPGEFSHHVESRPPKDSEKPGKGAKDQLRQKLSETPQIHTAASNFEATRTIA